MNAAGIRDTDYNELELLAQSDSGAIVVKTSTILPRQGNPEPRYKSLSTMSIQSMGLPNHGYKTYIRYIERLKEKYEKQGHSKPIIVSIAGFTEKEYLTLAEGFQHSKADMIEVNLSCPNIVGKRIIGYDLKGVDDLTKKLRLATDKVLGFKLPPYLDEVMIEKMSKIILNNNIEFVTCINSIPNTLIIDPATDKPWIKPNKGKGGLGGRCIKPIALGNVASFCHYLKDKVSIIGVGGISTGKDAYDFLLYGADAVQVGTQFMEEGIGCFARIQKELDEILRKKTLKIATTCRRRNAERFTPYNEENSFTK